jgi:hypothetical protein
MFTHYVAALMIGNCVTGVWLAAGAAFAATLNGTVSRCDIGPR